MLLNTTELVAGAATGAFRTTKFGDVAVVIEGDLDGETLTLQGRRWLSGDAGSWRTADLDDVTYTYSNSADSINVIGLRLPGGWEWRFSSSNGGGTLDNVYVHADGENIKETPIT